MEMDTSELTYDTYVNVVRNSSSGDPYFEPHKNL